MWNNGDVDKSDNNGVKRNGEEANLKYIVQVELKTHVRKSL